MVRGDIMGKISGLESIMWFRTLPKDREPSVFEIFNYYRCRNDSLDKKDSPDVIKVYALKSTSDGFKNVDCIELDQLAIVDEKDGNAFFSGKAISGCDIRTSNGNDANPIYRYEPKENQNIGVHDMTANDEVARTSPVGDIKIKKENREKIQEMINQGILTLPDDKCKEFKIEPFNSHVKQAA
jgi:hypothetical protein